MNDKTPRQRLAERLVANESKANSLLAFASVFAILLVVTSGLVSQEAHLPLLGLAFRKIEIGARAAIWLFFSINFVTYCALSKRPLSYIRHHLLELTICICWIPNSSYTSLTHFGDMLKLSQLVPLDVLQLIGTLCHAWRVVRSTARRFKSHPLFVTTLAAVVLIASSSALLSYVEPQTFTNFWDGAWYSITTITTIGYGDLVPHTTAGRIISVVLIISGIALFGIFIGLISELVRNYLMAPSKERQNPASLAENQELLKELLAAQKEGNDLLRELLKQKKQSQAPDENG